MNTNFIGQITETQVLLKCLELGLTVSIPYGDKSRYDLIIDYKGQLLRIQIKTSRKANTTKEAFMFNCYSVVNGKKHKYNKTEIDFFASVWNNKVYLVPVEECSSEKTLWVDTPLQPSCAKAEQYLLEEVLKHI